MDGGQETAGACVNDVVILRWGYQCLVVETATAANEVTVGAKKALEETAVTIAGSCTSVAEYSKFTGRS